MSLIRGFLGLASKFISAVIRHEAHQVAEELHDLEAQLARDLARRLCIPASAITVNTLPVPRVELKMALSRAQLAQVEDFLDKLRDTPRVNSRSRPGMH